MTGYRPAYFGLPRPFHSGVKSRHGTDGQTPWPIPRTRLFAKKAERYKYRENNDRQVDRYIHIQALNN